MRRERMNRFLEYEPLESGVVMGNTAGDAERTLFGRSGSSTVAHRFYGHHRAEKKPTGLAIGHSNTERGNVITAIKKTSITV